MHDTVRHQAIFDAASFRKPVHIIGCGGMGGRVAEGLVRMGAGQAISPITLYDHDSFESHNVANQLARMCDVGHSKVERVRQQLLYINPEATIKSLELKVRGNLRMSGVVFICVDSMNVRRDLMESLILKQAGISCVIETRMDAETGISHCFDPRRMSHVACWKQHWFSDEEADSTRGCSGPVSIISAIYATTALALQQLQQYARVGSAINVQNRLYQEFFNTRFTAEVWP